MAGGRSLLNNTFCVSETVEVYRIETNRWSKVLQRPSLPGFAFEAENTVFVKIKNLVFDTGIRVSPDEMYPVNLDEWRSVTELRFGSLVTCTSVNPKKLLGHARLYLTPVVDATRSIWV